jgi:hypothetical protein
MTPGSPAGNGGAALNGIRNVADPACWTAAIVATLIPAPELDGVALLPPEGVGLDAGP